jgi:hypothetical protein
MYSRHKKQNETKNCRKKQPKQEKKLTRKQQVKANKRVKMLKKQDDKIATACATGLAMCGTQLQVFFLTIIHMLDVFFPTSVSAIAREYMGTPSQLSPSQLKIFQHVISKQWISKLADSDISCNGSQVYATINGTDTLVHIAYDGMYGCTEMCGTFPREVLTITIDTHDTHKDAHRTLKKFYEDPDKYFGGRGCFYQPTNNDCNEVVQKICNEELQTFFGEKFPGVVHQNFLLETEFLGAFFMGKQLGFGLPPPFTVILEISCIQHANGGREIAWECIENRGRFWL